MSTIEVRKLRSLDYIYDISDSKYFHRVTFTELLWHRACSYGTIEIELEADKPIDQF